jgi:hypothetical protein
MGRKNRRSKRGMNRRTKRSKMNRRSKRSKMRGGSGSASAAPGKISMVIKNVGRASINVELWDNSKTAWRHLIEIPANGMTDPQSKKVGTEWRVTNADNPTERELSWVLRGEVPQVIDVNFTPSSASVTVSNGEVRGAAAAAPPSFREHTALKKNPSSATAGSTQGDSAVSGDYKKDWKKTSFYNDLFPHTEHVQRHVIFKKGERSGDFVVTQDSQNSDPENSRIDKWYHYITHTPSGKTYWDTQRFFA